MSQSEKLSPLEKLLHNQIYSNIHVMWGYLWGSWVTEINLNGVGTEKGKKFELAMDSLKKFETEFMDIFDEKPHYIDP
jgi:hypothetical protein